MLKARLAICACIIGLSAGGAQAADAYGSVGVSSFNTDLLDAKLAVVQGRVGVKLLPYLGVEAEAGTGFSDDTSHVRYAPFIWTTTTELNYQVAGYVVGFLPLTEKAELFARVGYGKAKFDYDWVIDNQSLSNSNSRDGWSYGGGGQYFFDGKNGVRLDYTRHDFDEDKVDAWSVGYVRRF